MTDKAQDIPNDTNVVTIEQLTKAVLAQEKQIQYLIMQVQNLYQRIGLAPLDVNAVTTQRQTRTETGMGLLPGADQTSYL